MPVDGGVRLADFNGDGKTDIAWSLNSSSEIWLSTGTGFVRGPAWPTPGSISLDGKDGGVRIADINGDGKADILVGVTWCVEVAAGGVTSCSSRRETWLSTGTGFVAGPAWPTAGVFSTTAGYIAGTGGTTTDGGLRLVDINGDGKLDFVWSLYQCRYYGGCQSHDETWLNTGGGWTAGPALPTSGFITRTYDTNAVASNPVQFLNAEAGLQLADINGDGKADVVWSVNECNYSFSSCAAHNEIWLGTGNGFSAGPAWPATAGSLAVWITNAEWPPLPGMKLVDMNGDGRADVVWSMHECTSLYGAGCQGHNEIWLSTGGGFSAGPAFPSQGHATLVNSYGQPSPGGLELTDVNGDTIPEVSRSLHECNWYDATCQDHNEVRLGQAGIDLLTSFTNDMGGSTSVVYKPSTAWVNTYLPKVIPTVSSVTANDGRGHTSTRSYAYSGGLWDTGERRFLGFRYTRETDGAGGYTETYVRQMPGYEAGRPEAVYRKDAAGKQLSHVTYTYAESASGGVYTSVVSQTQAQSCDGASACKTTQTGYTYDGYGNVTQTVEYGDTAVSGDERTTSTAFFPNTSAFIVGLPGLSRVYAGVGTAGALLSGDLYVYDANTAYNQAPTRGDATKVSAWNSQNNSWVSATNSYDAYGNQTRFTDPLGRATVTDFDATYHVFPVRVTNPLGQAVTTAWNAVLGVATSSTHVNGQVTSWVYDVLGRTTKETRPDGSTTTSAYVNIGNAAGQYVQETVSDGGSGQWSRSYLDGSGRVYKTESNPDHTVLTEYDAQGLVARASAAYSPAAGESPQWTSYTYDGLGRPLTVTNPDGSKRTSSHTLLINSADADYATGRWITLTCDEANACTRSAYDGYGRPVLVTQWNGTAERRTRISYDLLGRQVKSVDPVGNVSTTTWDSLGHKLSATSPDLGTWRYGYDAAGNLTSQTDARNVTTTMVYDNAGRLTQTKNGTTVLATYRYDEAGHGYGVGQMTSISDTSGSSSFTYDKLGRTTTQQQVIDGITYSVARTYDLAGREKTLTYPNGEVVTNTYDANGCQTGVASPTATYVAAATCNPRGDLNSLRLGNGLTETFTYHAQRQWLTGATVKNSAAAVVQSLAYTRDTVGRIKTVAADRSTDSWSYTYDSLGQLTQATNSGNTAWNQTFSYDNAGRMLSQTGVGAYTYNSGHAHAPSQVGTTAYTYDANGNRLTGGGTYTYDLLNRMATANGVTYTYDGSGQRVKAGTTIYQHLDGKLLYEKTPTGYSQYYYHQGQRIARRDNNGSASYYLSDHLGTSHRITDNTGSVVQTDILSPYGRTLQTTGTLTDRFGMAGQYQDPNGLYQMGARYMDPITGQFTSPDPSDYPNPTDPQSLNRYAYTLNNPINLTDPSGYGPCLTTAGNCRIPEKLPDIHIGKKTTPPADYGQVNIIGLRARAGIPATEDVPVTGVFGKVTDLIDFFNSWGFTQFPGASSPTEENWDPTWHSPNPNPSVVGSIRIGGKRVGGRIVGGRDVPTYDMTGHQPPQERPAGNLDQWITEAKNVLAANGVDTSSMTDADLRALIRHESAADPHSLNNWDRNARHGIPSKGLMQTIDSTFRANSVPGHRDIWNPVDNIVAGVRYGIDRYGSFDNIPGIRNLHGGGRYIGY